MEFTVTSKYLKISPRKVRPVVLGYRGINAEIALHTALFTNKKGAGFLKDLIKSGIAAAKENYIEPADLIIKSISCNEAPRLKRIVPWSKGQARRITKKMSHITLVLESVKTPNTNHQGTDKTDKDVENKEKEAKSKK